MASWKDVAIQQLERAQTKDEARKIAQAWCKEHCHVVNYNYHCERCKLVKRLLVVLDKLPEKVLR